MNTNVTPCEGGCACGYVRYTISSPPFIIHCCHCRFCQRQTGSAFALNALFDATSVNIIAGEVKEGLPLQAEEVKLLHVVQNVKSPFGVTTL